MITAILIYFAFKVEALENAWQKFVRKPPEGGSEASLLGTKEGAAATRLNKRESRDLAEQSAAIWRRRSGTKEDAVQSKGKEVMAGDVEGQWDAEDRN